jgi:hypothetical protein
VTLAPNPARRPWPDSFKPLLNAFRGGVGVLNKRNNRTHYLTRSSHAVRTLATFAILSAEHLSGVSLSRCQCG